MDARFEDFFEEDAFEVVSLRGNCGAGGLSLPSQRQEIKMLFVLEMIMLMVGVRVLLKGTLPRIPFVKPRYRLEKRAMKLLGVVLVIPIPVTIVVSLLLKLVLREAALGYDVALDWIVFAGTATATFIIVRRMWKS